MALSHEATFDRLFDQYRDPVQRYCLRRLPTDEGDDAAADVFLVAWRRIDELPADMELAWLYGIARNVVRNRYRSRDRMRSLRRRMASQPQVDLQDVETQVVRSDDHVAILRALSVLRPEDQELLRLKTWEELSNTEIALVLGASVRAVEMRATRARKRLAAAYRANEQRGNVTVRQAAPNGGGG